MLDENISEQALIIFLEIVYNIYDDDMSGFWQRLLNLEKAVKESSPSQPAIHELIQRSEEELADYEQWKSLFILKRLLSWLEDQYTTYRQKRASNDQSIDFLKLPSSQGFILYFHRTNYSLREATFLFDYFKERVKTLNYRTQISDTRTYSRNQWVERVEKHYLKPRLDYAEGEKMNQQFGNITIELEVRNDEVHNLRLRATHYQDFNFTPVQDFNDLMKVLLDQSVL